MATVQQNGFLTHLRGIVFAREADGLSDAQLLDGFLVHREEAAFAALVRRHGAMVLGVCRRVLRHECDAEDAFQATFLVLARKAASLGRPEQVSNWLYGVAYRTALKARARRARRHGREEPLSDSQFAMPEDARARHSLEPLIDDELRRLPEKYRSPIVLCYLEGKTKREAARCLGRPEGTVSTQLARGRNMLRRRLMRRGVALPMAALAAVLDDGPASAAVPPAAVDSICRAALAVAAGKTVTHLVSAPVAALMRGVLRAMFWTKVKSICVVGLGISLLFAACAAGLLAMAQAPDDREEQQSTFLAIAPANGAVDDSQPPKKDKADKEAPPKNKPTPMHHTATEERTQWIPYVEKTPLEVRTNNGPVHVTTDAALLGRNNVEGKLVAKITASGATEEEAKSRLAKVKIAVSRREQDKALVISAEFPDKPHDNEGCAFEVSMPATNGVTIHTGNGAVGVEKVTGTVSVETGNGAVKVDQATGRVKVHSGNGPLAALHVQGEIDLDTGNGAIVYESDAKAGAFKLKSGNGAVSVRLPAGGEGSVTANTSNGIITVHGAGAEQTVTGGRTSRTVKLSSKDVTSTIHTNNGPITIELAK